MGSNGVFADMAETEGECRKLREELSATKSELQRIRDGQKSERAQRPFCWVGGEALRKLGDEGACFKLYPAKPLGFRADEIGWVPLFTGPPDTMAMIAKLATEHEAMSKTLTEAQDAGTKLAEEKRKLEAELAQESAKVGELQTGLDAIQAQHDKIMADMRAVRDRATPADMPEAERAKLTLWDAVVRLDERRKGLQDENELLKQDRQILADGVTALGGSIGLGPGGHVRCTTRPFSTTTVRPQRQPTLAEATAWLDEHYNHEWGGRGDDMVYRAETKSSYVVRPTREDAVVALAMLLGWPRPAPSVPRPDAKAPPDGSQAAAGEATRQGATSQFKTLIIGASQQPDIVHATGRVGGKFGRRTITIGHADPAWSGLYRKVEKPEPDGCPMPASGSKDWRWSIDRTGTFSDGELKVMYCQVEAPEDIGSTLWRWLFMNGNTLLSSGHRRTRTGAMRAAERSARVEWRIRNQQKGTP
ncbi:MAG: hypothetical protein WC683_16150 [bacterium]